MSLMESREEINVIGGPPVLSGLHPNGTRNWCPLMEGSEQGTKVFVPSGVSARGLTERKQE